MLENIASMFKTNDPETIDLARNIVLNEPLLNIIIGTPTCRQNAKTLYNRALHCKFKRLSGSGKYDPISIYKVCEEYKWISIAIEGTLTKGYYYLYD